MTGEGALPPDPFHSHCEELLGELLFATGKLIARGDECPPIMVLYFSDPPRRDVIEIPFKNTRQKDIVARLQRLIAETPGVDCIAIVTEAWYVAQEVGQPRPEGSLEHVPGRSEALLVSFMRGKRQLLAMCPIDRTTKTITRRPLVDPREGAAEGRFIAPQPLDS